MATNLWQLVFGNNSRLTGNYHDGGSIVLVADSKEQAIEKAKAEFSNINWEEFDAAYSYPIDGLVVCGDAGCC